MKKNNQQTYSFFDIPKGASDITVDFSTVNKTPLVKTITAPEANFGISVSAKSNPQYFDAQPLGAGSSFSNTLKFAYPKETFPEYETDGTCTIGDKTYDIVTTGTTIPDHIETFDATFKISGSSLADFVPSFAGAFDYYHANFQSAAGLGLIVELYSSAAANFTNIKLPDFSKYLGLSKLNLTQ